MMILSKMMGSSTFFEISGIEIPDNYETQMLTGNSMKYIPARNHAAHRLKSRAGHSRPPAARRRRKCRSGTFRPQKERKPLRPQAA